MAFIFTCGTHTFRSQLEGFENTTVQCHNCGNWSGRISKEWEWFTFCFVPLIPFSLKPWKEVFCPICRFRQPVDARPDVQQMLANGPGGAGGGAAAGGGSNGQQIPLQGAGPQGWNSGPPPQNKAPGGQYQQGPSMENGGQAVYK